MPDITEHYSDQERESHDREKCWVYFLVPRYTISIYDKLEWSCEIVKFEMRRWC